MAETVVSCDGSCTMSHFCEYVHMHSYTVRKVNKIKEFEDSKSDVNKTKDWAFVQSASFWCFE